MISPYPAVRSQKGPNQPHYRDSNPTSALLPMCSFRHIVTLFTIACDTLCVVLLQRVYKLKLHELVVVCMSFELRATTAGRSVQHPHVLTAMCMSCVDDGL
jgi:hypothetical protein